MSEFYKHGTKTWSFIKTKHFLTSRATKNVCDLTASSWTSPGRSEMMQLVLGVTRESFHFRRAYKKVKMAEETRELQSQLHNFFKTKKILLYRSKIRTHRPGWIGDRNSALATVLQADFTI